MSRPESVGMIDLASSHSVEEIVARVKQELEAAGMTLFAEIDHQENARAAGVSMRPSTLLIFGNPRVGTALMRDHPRLAIDLPLKALAWEDGDGRIWLSANDPAYLQQRYGLPETPFQALPGLLQRALSRESPPG